jgi:hypothetical protein
MRSFSRYLAAGLVLVAAAACNDATSVATSPRTRSLSPAAPVFDFGSTGHSFGLLSSEFTVTSRGGSFAVAGLYTVNFPENSVCNPDNSSYGPTEWDKSCSTLRAGQSIRVHAVLSLASGGLAIDFTPALRFSPATEVTISTDIFAPVLKANRDYFLKHPASLNSLAIYYAPSLASGPVKDFVADPSLITQVNLTTGKIWRRAKHFSGFSLPGGQACEPSPELPECVQVTDRTPGQP